jgi:3-hydroxyisobutyrate dehydrogenase
MKLVNNMVLGAFMAALAEAAAAAEKVGLDKAQALEILAVGAGNSAVLNAKKARLVERDFSPQFAAEAMYKDLRLMTELARKTGAPSAMGPAAEKLFGEVCAQGHKDQDLSVVYELLRGK